MGICSVSRKIEPVLLALAEKPMTRKEIEFKLGLGSGTVHKIVHWLLDKGLAEEVAVSRYRVEVRLTERGRKLAELVRAVEELVGD